MFRIRINNVAKELTSAIHRPLYVDYFTVSYRSQSMHFQKLKQNTCNFVIKFYDVIIEECNSVGKNHNVDKFKFLGIILDKKLTFIPYLKYLRRKFSKTLKLLRDQSGYAAKIIQNINPNQAVVWKLHMRISKKIISQNT